MDWEYLRKVGLSLATAAKREDETAVAKWAIKALTIVVPGFDAEPDPVVVNMEADLFEPGDDAAVYMVGGSPGNPNGVTMTWGQAKAWWTVAFAYGRNLSRVRPTLQPGAAVLTPKGYKAAVALNDSTEYAPEDWNPLGLEVIP